MNHEPRAKLSYSTFIYNNLFQSSLRLVVKLVCCYNRHPHALDKRSDRSHRHTHRQTNKLTNPHWRDTHTDIPSVTHSYTLIQTLTQSHSLDPALSPSKKTNFFFPITCDMLTKNPNFSVTFRVNTL